MRLPVSLSTIIWATSVLARPRDSTFSGHTGGISRQSNPGLSRSIDNDYSHKARGHAKRDVTYNGNWIGAVLTSPPTATEIWDSVTGTIKVPNPAAPAGAPDGVYGASIWVGLDGDTTTGPQILQAGISVIANVTGGQTTGSFNVWYEWLPAFSTFIDESKFSIAAGDTLNITVTSSSPSQGTINLHNISSGKSFSQAVDSPNPGPEDDLVGQNAEWIVEDYTLDWQNGTVAKVPLVDFGTVDFTSCFAMSNTGEVFGTSNATVLELFSKDTVVGIPGPYEVNIAHRSADSSSLGTQSQSSQPASSSTGLSSTSSILAITTSSAATTSLPFSASSSTTKSSTSSTLVVTTSSVTTTSFSALSNIYSNTTTTPTTTVSSTLTTSSGIIQSSSLSSQLSLSSSSTTRSVSTNIPNHTTIEKVDKPSSTVSHSSHSTASSTGSSASGLVSAIMDAIADPVTGLISEVPHNRVV